MIKKSPCICIILYKFDQSVVWYPAQTGVSVFGSACFALRRLLTSICDSRSPEKLQMIGVRSLT